MSKKRWFDWYIFEQVKSQWYLSGTHLCPPSTKHIISAVFLAIIVFTCAHLVWWILVHWGVLLVVKRILCVSPENLGFFAYCVNNRVCSHGTVLTLNCKLWSCLLLAVIYVLVCKISLMCKTKWPDLCSFTHLMELWALQELYYLYYKCPDAHIYPAKHDSVALCNKILFLNTFKRFIIYIYRYCRTFLPENECSGRLT